jgi:hypothetical protein
VLVRLGYLTTDEYLFCPVFRQEFKGEQLQHFRYAYNSSAVDTGGTAGAPDNVDRDSSDIWFARCMYVPLEESFDSTARQIHYPHGENRDRENALMSNSRVELRDGKADFDRQFHPSH